MAFSSSFIFQVIFACNGQSQCDTTIYQSCDSAFTSSNIKLHQMLFLSLYGNDNRLSYKSIYILLLKLFHNSVNTTYRTSSWCNRYYKFVALCPFISIEYSSLFHLLHDRFLSFFSLPSPSPLPHFTRFYSWSPVFARWIFTTLFANTFYKFYAKRHGA